MSELHVKNVSKSFSNSERDLTVLTNITFSIKSGQVVAMLGKSGSGKTTLLNIISGLETTSAGNIEYEGGVSYTPQKDLLLPWRNTINNILLPFEIKKSINESDKIKINALVDEMEMGEFTQSYPHELSGGMRQKVSLIRSLAQDKQLYLFDEALSAIDFDSRLKLTRKIRNILVHEDKIGVFITHNIEEAISIADKVIVFSPRPARIIYETNINIPNVSRDPIGIRKNPEFQKQFDILWKVLART